MTYDDLVIKPTEDTVSIRRLIKVDHEKLLASMTSFTAKLTEEVSQIGLRWANDFEGITDLRDKTVNIHGYGSSDFRTWQPGTELLQSISNEIGIRDYGRVRMLKIPPQKCYTFHHDPDLYRVHIPLITNSGAFFIVDGKLWHLEAGYAYLVKVKDFHTAINTGKEDRVHIVYDRCDYLL